MANQSAILALEQGLQTLSTNPKLAAQYLTAAIQGLGGVDAIVRCLRGAPAPITTKTKFVPTLTGSAAAYTLTGKRSELERHAHAERCRALLAVIPDDEFSATDREFVAGMQGWSTHHHKWKQEKWLHDLEFNFELRDDEWVR